MADVGSTFSQFFQGSEAFQVTGQGFRPAEKSASFLGNREELFRKEVRTHQSEKEKGSWYRLFNVWEVKNAREYHCKAINQPGSGHNNPGYEMQQGKFSLTGRRNAQVADQIEIHEDDKYQYIRF